VGNAYIDGLLLAEEMRILARHVGITNPLPNMSLVLQASAAGLGRILKRDDAQSLMTI
jgi:hypothetical protein